jgi:hypothetical protein
MRRIFKGRRPSPGLVVAILALCVGVAGTAVASVATISVLTKKEKRQVKKIVNKRIKKKISPLQTSSGFNENSTVIPSLGATFVTVASANITTHSSGRVLATGSAELSGADANETGACQIVIGGVASLAYDTDPDDIGADNKDIVAVNFARTLSAGTYTATLQCRAVTGTVGKNDAGINVYGLGS